MEANVLLSFPVAIGEDRFLRNLMWIPRHGADVDRHHQLYFKCHTCRPLQMACQFFGHSSDIECHAPALDTIYDQPVCNLDDCPQKDFMKPTHNLVQTFCDADFNRVNVYFTNTEQVESFFVRFPAKQCLDRDVVYCRFLAVIQFYQSLEASNTFFPSELVVRKETTASGLEKLYFVIGALSDRLCP